MYRQGVFPLLLLLSTLYPVKPDCRPAEEGQETTLTCTVNTAALVCPSTLLEWRVNKLTPIIECNSNRCGGGYSSVYGFSATINNSGSTLTISNVSRTDPFNMETRWVCAPCGDSSRQITTCDKLEVYAKQENRSCTVRENTPVPGDIESVTVSCSTTKVYPEAKCSFEQRTNGGTFVTINKSPTYSHTNLTGTPVYYRSECSVDVPVADLGEGTHSFRAFIYPDVTNGINLVTATIASTNVTLTLPGAPSYSCSTEMIQGYFNGKSARCTCSLTPDGYPKGQAQWYRGSQTVPGLSGGVLDLTFDSSNPEQVYTCKGVSAIGEGSISTLRAKFAFFEQDTVVSTSPNNNSIFDLCDDSNQITAGCAVLKDHVYPAPTFSFSQTNVPFDNSQERQDDSYYQRQIDLRPDVGGIYQVICTVTNTIIGKTQSKETSLTFIQPPPLPPKIIIKGETYQDVNALNRITLAAGYTGDMTCRVEGGYPKAHTTQLTCGPRTASGEENVVALTFQAGQLNKDMDGTECKCISQHVTGCYFNKETNLTLDVTYAPVVTFTHDSASLQFNEGDTPTFTCTAQGNPPPNLTITRKRTTKQLANVQKNLKTAELTHTMEPLECLDTDVYVCTGQNNQGVTTKEISLGVKCPQQLVPKNSQPEIVDVALGETAELGLEIYGYPAPELLTLIRTTDNINLTGSARHLIEYSPGQAPFGSVNVTIVLVEEEDFTNYTLTVDNGVGDPLVYPFYLIKVNATEKVKQEEQGGSEDDTVAIAVSVTVAVVAVVVIAVVLVIFVLRYRAASRKAPLFQPAKENRYVDIFPDPADGYEVPVTQSEGGGMRPEGRNHVQVHAYEEIDPQPVNGYEMPDGLIHEEAPSQRQLRVNQYEEINPRQVNQYDVPRGLLQEEDMKLKDETVQQPYTNFISPEQETKGTNHNYSNLGFDISEEKCVYVNTTSHGTGRVK
ncbi:vascular cell adhesion protein 1 [Plakobranchus ocellatus]|uniref:Vascular cell adhesion protein 1 n=1 Tax=Plakobranchus ocellatus TaxID=259542 RepID=A0AAV3YQF0_9GAST|nr:vascular cell adhesion protein 1 [Plakobranchus ocellatus]